ncbi:MAG: ATP-binding cassette domain-containing protein [Ilumatobacteraceae bacterium]
MPEPACVELAAVGVSRGDAIVVDHVDLRIVAGECVGLVGPSGAGKSTLISTMNTSLAPAHGMLRLFGVNPWQVAATERRQLRMRIGTVHQDLHLLGPLRVVHNVNAGHLGQWSTLTALRSLLRPVGVDDARAALAGLGVEHLLWRRTDELSGGERQRVALARLMVQGAELLLADEPTASLDPARAEDVVRAFTEHARRHANALVISMHSFELARRYCDRLVGMRSGSIVFDLPAAQVDDATAVQLYQLQPE